MGGFIGSAAKGMLVNRGFTVRRGEWQVEDFQRKQLGTVVIACGVGDCRRIEDVLHSHLDVVRNIIKTAEYDRIVYISSTRVYLDSEQSSETSPLLINPDDSRVLFNQVKLIAETIIKAQSKPALILRPSNVYGKAFNSPLFLPSLVRDAITKHVINLYVTPEYSKDYVYCEDVCMAIVNGIEKEITGTYNIASGENVAANDIVKIIAGRTECDVVWHDTSVLDQFPLIDITAMESVFGLKPVRVADMLNEMIDDFTNEFNK